MQCTLVRPVFRGYHMAKFVDDREPKRINLISYEQCPDEAVVQETDGQFVFHHCAHHINHNGLLSPVNMEKTNDLEGTVQQDA